LQPLCSHCLAVHDDLAILVQDPQSHRHRPRF
jgi:hypothetical protein